MDDFETVDTGTLLAGRSDWLTDEHASRLAEHPLASVATEYPHYVREAESADGVDAPSDTHPVFCGCYDWHSAVHSHGALVRQLRLFDDHPDERAVRESVDVGVRTASSGRRPETARGRRLSGSRSAVRRPRTRGWSTPSRRASAGGRSASRR